MGMVMMPNRSVVIMRVIVAGFVAGALSVALAAAPCRGSDRASADPTITLEVKNEPLRTVLEKISKTTRWQIKAPDKWMDKPITQTLTRVSIEEGLRFILKDAGVENLLLTYDENNKKITIYDTENLQGQSANRPAALGDAPPPAFSPVNQSDPMLTRPAKEAGSGPSRGTTRARKRQQIYKEEE